MPTPNEYKQFGFFNATGKLPNNAPPSSAKKKEYVLTENGNEIQSGSYALLVSTKRDKIKAGCRPDLLKIKPKSNKAKL